MSQCIPEFIPTQYNFLEQYVSHVADVKRVYTNSVRYKIVYFHVKNSYFRLARETSGTRSAKRAMNWHAMKNTGATVGAL